MLDEEKEQMLSSARATAPRTSDDYDYSNYHTIADVSSVSRNASGKEKWDSPFRMTTQSSTHSGRHY